MNWRAWVYEKLSTAPEVTSIIPADQIYGAGALNLVPTTRPFITLRFMPAIRNVVNGRNDEVVVWVHDEPGDYGRIDEALAAVRTVLDEHVPDLPGSIVVRWQGESQDLADDGYGTITRNASYLLVGT